MLKSPPSLFIKKNWKYPRFVSQKFGGNLNLEKKIYQKLPKQPAEKKIFGSKKGLKKSPFIGTKMPPGGFFLPHFWEKYPVFLEKPQSNKKKGLKKGEDPGR